MGWMVTDLRLKGNELLVYALVYGFCQDGGSEFTGSVSYIQEWTGMTYRGALNILQSLVAKGLLIKRDIVENRVKLCHYEAVPPSEKISEGMKKFHHPSEKISDNNTNDITKPKGLYISNPPTPIKFDFRAALLSLHIDRELVDAWLQVRKAKKAVNTEVAFRAIKREIEKAGKPASECIRFAVERSWSGFRAEWMQNERNQRTAPAPRATAVDRLLAMTDELYGPITPRYDEQ